MKRARLRRLERVSPMRVEGDADGEGTCRGDDQVSIAAPFVPS